MAYYYYMDGQTRKGPIELHQMVKEITLDSYIWCEGMENWQKASSVPAVVDAYNENKNNQFDAQNNSVNQFSNNNYYADGNNNYTDGNTDYRNVQNNGQKMQNYFVLSLVCLLLCCVPLGIVSLINSRNCDKALMEGNTRLAEEYAQKAKKWAILGMILGFVFQIIYFVLVVTGELMK